VIAVHLNVCGDVRRVSLYMAHSLLLLLYRLTTQRILKTTEYVGNHDFLLTIIYDPCRLTSCVGVSSVQTMPVSA